MTSSSVTRHVTEGAVGLRFRGWRLALHRGLEKDEKKSEREGEQAGEFSGKETNFPPRNEFSSRGVAAGDEIEIGRSAQPEVFLASAGWQL